MHVSFFNVRVGFSQRVALTHVEDVVQEVFHAMPQVHHGVGKVAELAQDFTCAEEKKRMHCVFCFNTRKS